MKSRVAIIVLIKTVSKSAVKNEEYRASALDRTPFVDKNGEQNRNEK